MILCLDLLKALLSLGVPLRDVLFSFSILFIRQENIKDNIWVFTSIMCFWKEEFMAPDLPFTILEIIIGREREIERTKTKFWTLIDLCCKFLFIMLTCSSRVIFWHRTMRDWLVSAKGVNMGIFLFHLILYYMDTKQMCPKAFRGRVKFCCKFNEK